MSCAQQLNFITSFVVSQDGVISFEEFVKAIAIPISGTVDEKLNCELRGEPANAFLIKSRSPGAFTIYDVDNDGYVTKDEMLKIVGAICEKRPASERAQARNRVERIFLSMDAVSEAHNFIDSLFSFFRIKMADCHEKSLSKASRTIRVSFELC